jgi:hypothetical protein
MNVAVIIFEIYIATTLIPLCIYFLTRKYQDASIGYLAVMLFFSFLVDCFGLLSHFWLHIGKTLNAVNNFYGFLELVTVVMLYQMQLSSGKRKPFFLLAGILILAQLSEMFIFRGVTEFVGTSRSIFSITVTIFALLYFFRLIKSLPVIHVYYIPMFWINIGMLVYFTGNFFVFVMQNYLVDVMKSDFVFHQSVHNLLGIFANILFSIGLWQAKRTEGPQNMVIG